MTLSFHIQDEYMYDAMIKYTSYSCYMIVLCICANVLHHKSVCGDITFLNLIISSFDKLYVGKNFICIVLGNEYEVKFIINLLQLQKVHNLFLRGAYLGCFYWELMARWYKYI